MLRLRGSPVPPHNLSPATRGIHETPAPLRPVPRPRRCDKRDCAHHSLLGREPHQANGVSKRLRVLLFAGVCLIIVCGSAIYLSIFSHERLRIELVDIACIDDDEDWRVAAKVSSVSDFVETRIFHAALFQNTDEGSTQLDHARGPSSVIDNKFIVELRYPLVEGRTYSVAAFTIESCPITIKRRLSMA